jgi:hypothetical protein
LSVNKERNYYYVWVFEGHGAPFHDITKDTAFYTSTSRFVAWLGTLPQVRQVILSPRFVRCPRMILRTPPARSPPLVTDYDCKDSASPSLSPAWSSVDLCLTHERFGSSSNPSLHGDFHYPAQGLLTLIKLNETAADRIRDYRADYHESPSL